jgi:hypothetical protein
MCTVSWVHQPDGYHLLSNRDEMRTRGIATAPRVMERGGIRYIAPVDADYGGAWLAANERGLSVSLLNGVPDPTAGPAGSSRRSRGLLIHELAWAPSASECIFWMKQLDLGPLAPFILLVLEPGQSAILAKWDGRELAVDPAGDSQMPLTSSSYDAAGVRRSRLKEFARRVGAAERLDPALLYWFHTSHGSAPDAYSTCMHRENAETVSFSWVSVTRDSIRFLYSPAAPCRCSPCEQEVLFRAA